MRELTTFNERERWAIANVAHLRLLAALCISKGSFKSYQPCDVASQCIALTQVACLDLMGILRTNLRRRTLKIKAEISLSGVLSRSSLENRGCFGGFFGGFLLAACFSKENDPKKIHRGNQTPKATSNFREGVSLTLKSTQIIGVPKSEFSRSQEGGRRGEGRRLKGKERGRMREIWGGGKENSDLVPYD